MSTIPSACHLLDLCFLLDASGSVGRGNWRHLLALLRAVVARLHVGLLNAQVAVVVFGNDAHLQVALDQFANKKDLQEALEELEFLDQGGDVS